MSYILDALKKSDQQRRRGATPTLLTTPMTETASRQPSVLWYGLLALGLVGAGIAIGSFSPREPTHALPAKESVTATQSSDSNTGRETPAFRPAPSQIAGNPELRVKRSASGTRHPPIPTSAVIKHDESSRPRTKAQHTPRKVVASVPKEAASPPSRSKSTQPALAEPRVMPMSELPLSIQRELPTMSISAHAYSSQPKDRLVSINDQLLREGASLAPGLRLEEITPDGMIFSYKGYRFYHGVKSSAATARSR